MAFKKFKHQLIAVIAAAAWVPLAAFPAAACKLIIFHAGSLSVPFAKIEKQFEAAHPGIDVLRKPGGSTKMARMISELNKPADIMASADFTVIDKNLIPEKATWNIRFATNQLVLCYTSKSKFSGNVSTANWHQILAKKGVRWGHSDPDLDPCGYRSLMVLKLAEKYYSQKGLYQRLIANRPPKYVRPKSAELVSMLQAGYLDYAWEYLSVAVQHGLQYVKLPERINLGNYKYDEFYRQAAVKVSGKKPGTWIIRRGKSCTYGITMIKNCKNRQAALDFLDYLLNPEGGLKVMKQIGQPPFVPCRVPNRKMKARLPEKLAQWVEVRN